jgi:hypothetical protein
MFWQNTLLIPKEVYHEKEKNSNSIQQNESGVSIPNWMKCCILKGNLKTSIAGRNQYFIGATF